MPLHARYTLKNVPSVDALELRFGFATKTVAYELRPVSPGYTDIVFEGAEDAVMNIADDFVGGPNAKEFTVFNCDPGELIAYTMRRLENTCPDDHQIEERDKGPILCDIDAKLSAGWLPAEIVALLRNMEEVNPSLEEDVALRRMAHVNEVVNRRLGVKRA